MSAACAASLFAWVGLAAAQDAAPDAPGNAPGNAPSAAPGNAPSATPSNAPSATPTFSMMDPTGDASKIDVDGSLVIARDRGGGGGHLWHGRVLAQLVAPEHIGAYLAISASHGDDDTVLHDFEIGAVGQTTVSPNLDLGLRAGIAANTHSEDAQLLGLVALASLRPSDLLTIEDATLARLSVSATAHQGPVFARIDLGLDITVDDRTEKLGHLNAGFGFQANQLTTALELQAAHGLEDSDDGTIGNVGVSLRYHGPRVAPYVRVSTPFGDGFGFLDLVGITAGASFAL